MYYFDCSAQEGDTLSYQDTFKWLDTEEGRAYNTQPDGWNWFPLDITYGRVGASEDDDDSEYDSYHDSYVSEVTTVYVSGREETCDVNDLEDFIRVNGELHHEDDVAECSCCEGYYLVTDAITSDLTSEDYCCDTCKEKAEKEYKAENWYWSDYDEEYFEDDADIVTYQKYNSSTCEYTEATISEASYTELIETGDLHLIGDVAYDMVDSVTGLAYGQLAILTNHEEEALEVCNY